MGESIQLCGGVVNNKAAYCFKYCFKCPNAILREFEGNYEDKGLNMQKWIILAAICLIIQKAPSPGFSIFASLPDSG